MADGFDYNTRGVISNRLVVMMSNRKVCAGTQSHSRWLEDLLSMDWLPMDNRISHASKVSIDHHCNIYATRRRSRGTFGYTYILSGAQEGGLIEVAISVNELD